MMKYIFIISCLLVHCIIAKAIDSNRDTVIVKAKITNFSLSHNQFDLGTSEGQCDVLVESFCIKDSSLLMRYLYLKINDTIKNIKFTGSEEDTFILNESYIFVDFPDSTHLFSNSDRVSFPIRLKNEPTLFDQYCLAFSPKSSHSFTKDSICNKAVSGKRKTKDFTYFANGFKKSKSVCRTKANGKIVRKTTIWNEKGKKITKTRKKGYPYDRGSRTVVWTFRENGKTCIRRGIQILK